MPTDWGALAPETSVYVEPAGWMPPSPGADVAFLAGTLASFASVKLIARDRRRVAETMVPIAEREALFAQLIPAHRARALAQWRYLISPRPPLDLGRHGAMRLDRPRIMGILNTTPDSFSDGGRHFDPGAAVRHGQAMLEAGADLIDVGGESTRPGAKPVWQGDEIARVSPAITALAPSVPVSIDSRRAAVMQAALAAGAVLVNDVSALQYDDDAIGLVAAGQCPVVLMHAAGAPETMQADPRYDDVLLDVYDRLEARVEACIAAGIDRARIIVDPGIGFGKTLRHNLTLIHGLGLFHGLGCALLLGASRKSFIGAVSREEPAADRIPGSLAAALAGLDRGVHILRVHDVAETAQATALWLALRDAGLMPPG